MQNFGTKVAAQSKFYLICVRKKGSMFSLDNFINDCKKSVTQDSSHLAVKENIERAISSPKEILKETENRQQNQLWIRRKILMK